MLPIAISPCPNDTFLFWAWIQGIVGSQLPVKVHFSDIETLNNWALIDKFPLLKVSIKTYAEIKDRYHLLPIGMALGYGVGPKIISPNPYCDLASSKVALPGKTTSAHLFFDLFYKAKEKIFCPYHEVFSLLHEKKADAGVIIHESRFTFQNEGFHEIADLGILWERRYQLPIPLGGIVLHKDIGHYEEITSILKESFSAAQKKTLPMYEYILQHSQEKTKAIVQNHIDLYVTQETKELSLTGKAAITKLLELYSGLNFR